MKLTYLLIMVCSTFALNVDAASIPGGSGQSGGFSAPPTIDVTANGIVVPDGGIHLVNLNDTVSAESFAISIGNSAAGLTTITTTITNRGSTGILESDWEAVQQVPFSVSPTLGTFNTTGGVVHLVTIVAANGTNSITFSFSLVQDHPLITVREGLNEITPGLSATGSGRDFGSQQVTAGSTGQLTITILNTGNAYLHLGMPTVTGTAATEFVVTSPVQISVPASSSTTFTVTFDPTVGGVHIANIEFVHSDATVQSPFTFEVVGVGIPPAPAPILVVRDSDQNGAIVSNGSAASGSRDFGTVLISGIPTANSIVYLKNEGNADLIMALPTFSGSGFTVDTSNFSTTLTPGSSCTIGFALTSVTAASYAATISFTHNDATTTTPFSFDLAGTVDDGSISFGSGGGGSGGGCAATNSHTALWAILILLSSAALMYRRRKLA